MNSDRQLTKRVNITGIMCFSSEKKTLDKRNNMVLYRVMLTAVGT